MRFNVLLEQHKHLLYLIVLIVKIKTLMKKLMAQNMMYKNYVLNVETINLSFAIKEKCNLYVNNIYMCVTAYLKT